MPTGGRSIPILVPIACFTDGTALNIKRRGTTAAVAASPINPNAIPVSNPIIANNVKFIIYIYIPSLLKIDFIFNNEPTVQEMTEILMAAAKKQPKTTFGSELGFDLGPGFGFALGPVDKKLGNRATPEKNEKNLKIITKYK